MQTASPWKAKAHSQFNDKTHKQMKNLLGMTDSTQLKYLYAKSNADQAADEQQVFLQEQSRINFKNTLRSNTLKKKYDKIVTNSTGITDKILCKQSYPDGTPKCFDWRNVNGSNYDTPIKKQGDCGSCYSVAMISTVESRIRIQSNNT